MKLTTNLSASHKVFDLHYLTSAPAGTVGFLLLPPFSCYVICFCIVSFLSCPGVDEVRVALLSKSSQGGGTMQHAQLQMRYFLPGGAVS
jgi:hypothetical protein